MKRNVLTPLSCSIFVAGLSLTALAEDSAQPTLFVAPFTGSTTSIQYWQPAMGEGLCEMLITELGKINKFQVLESTQLGALKDEIKMGEDGFIDQNEKVEKGGWSAADFMFTAKVTRFGSQDTKVGLGGFVPGSLGSLGVRQSTSDVRIDWRLVDANNRKIIKTGSAVGTKKGVGFNVGVGVNGRGGGIGFDNKEFMDSALGKATVMALNQIISDISPITLPESSRHKQKAGIATQKAADAQAAVTAVHATPGQVLAVPTKDIVIVSLGTKQGFKAGDKLNLFETVDTKDANGTVVFTEEKLVGEITLQSLQDERSKASYAGDLIIKPGWIVRGK
jgi:curli biogenesis system outer membrane secretion channel CsgG